MRRKHTNQLPWNIFLIAKILANHCVSLRKSIDKYNQENLYKNALARNNSASYFLDIMLRSIATV